MSKNKLARNILIGALTALLPLVGFSQAYKQDASNTAQDWADTLNAMVHIHASEKILLHYQNECRDLEAIKPTVDDGIANWYELNGQYVNASKWAVGYYGFISKIDADTFSKNIHEGSDKIAGALIENVNGASKALSIKEKCSFIFGSQSPFIGTLVDHKTFRKLIIKIRDMHKEYEDEMVKRGK